MNIPERPYIPLLLLLLLVTLEKWVCYVRLIFIFVGCLIFIITMTYIGAGVALLVQSYVGEVAAFFIVVAFFMGSMVTALLCGEKRLRRAAEGLEIPRPLLWYLLREIARTAEGGITL